MMFNKIIRFFLIACLTGGAFVSCKDYDFPVDESYNRLFRPPVVEATEIDATSALLNWVKVNGPQKYIIEISQDSLEFKDVTTYEVSAKYDTLRVFDLYSEANYSFRVKAVDTTGVNVESEYNPLFFQTPGEQIFESVYQTLDRELNTNITKLNWIPKSKVSALTIQSESGDEEEIILTQEQIDAGEITLTHLLNDSEYIIKILRDGNKRGLLGIHTNEAYPAGYIFVNEGSTIADALAGAPVNAVLVIPSDVTIDDQKLTVPAHIQTLDIWGEPDSIKGSLIVTTIVPSDVMTDLRIKNLNVDGLSSGSNYMFNLNKTIGLSNVALEDCFLHNFRGLFRMQKSDNACHINQFTIKNCEVNNVGGYGIINSKGTLSSFDNISITNSTFSNVEMFARIAGPVTGVVEMRYCTFYNTISKGKYLFEFFDDEANISAMFNFTNLLFGKFWYSGAYVDLTSVKSSNYPTLFSFVDSYATNDFVTNETKPFTMLNVYNGSSADVFADPANPERGDYTIIDANFPGVDIAGDPRWRK